MQVPSSVAIDLEYAYRLNSLYLILYSLKWKRAFHGVLLKTRCHALYFNQIHHRAAQRQSGNERIWYYCTKPPAELSLLKQVMCNEPLSSIFVSKKFRDSHIKSSPIRFPLGRLRAICCVQNRTNLLHIPVEVRQPALRRLCVVPAIDSPPIHHFDVVLEVGQQIVASIVPPVKKYFPIQLLSPSVSKWYTNL